MRADHTHIHAGTNTKPTHTHVFTRLHFHFYYYRHCTYCRIVLVTAPPSPSFPLPFFHFLFPCQVLSCPVMQLRNPQSNLKKKKLLESESAWHYKGHPDFPLFISVPGEDWFKRSRKEKKKKKWNKKGKAKRKRKGMCVPRQEINKSVLPSAAMQRRLFFFTSLSLLLNLRLKKKAAFICSDLSIHLT